MEDQPGPNAPAPGASSESWEDDTELYTRSNSREAPAPVKTRSASGSTKLPVVVLTGSSAYPDVWGSPMIWGEATSRGLRFSATPAASRHAAMASSETVEMPPSPPPAASKASATVFTQVASPVLLEVNEVRAAVMPEASIVHQAQAVAKSEIAPSRVPFWVTTVSLAPLILVA